MPGIHFLLDIPERRPSEKAGPCLCERCGGKVRSRAHNFCYCGACREDATREEQSLAWKHRTRGVPRVPRKQRECPDYESPGTHDFARLDGLQICRYCFHTEQAG